jgi:hypothetical protein
MSLQIRISLALILMLCTLTGCQPPATQGSSPAPSAARTSSQSTGAPTHDLSQDEAAGGHTLKKHVGRSDDQLRERLQRERNISAASTYTDRATAEMAVGVALQQNQAKIDRWLNREGGHPNLVVDYDGDSAHPIGRTMRRGDDQSEPCSRAVVILNWDGDRSYHVLTTYPECR